MKTGKKWHKKCIFPILITLTHMYCIRRKVSTSGVCTDWLVLWLHFFIWLWYQWSQLVTNHIPVSRNHHWPIKHILLLTSVIVLLNWVSIQFAVVIGGDLCSISGGQMCSYYRMAFSEPLPGWKGSLALKKNSTKCFCFGIPFYLFEIFCGRT